jgi:prepilin-type N-terminal cleavage/methylation domain-containing protein
MKSDKGFTLIEIVMVIMIVSVLSMAGYHIMRFMIQHSFFLPNQVQTDLVAADALEIMVEGELPDTRGLRYCKAVTALAANQVDVTDQDDVALRFRLDTGTGRLYRRIGAAAETQVPYYMPAGVVFSGSGGALFRYYDGSNPEVVTATPTDVRRIQIDLIAQQGTGSVDNFQGRSVQSTSVKVNKYV